MARIFLLSPASCSGKRAQLLLREEASFDLAVRLRSSVGAPLGEVFSFLSGLYFRGKLAYSTAFVQPPEGFSADDAVRVITTNRGLMRTTEMVTAATLRRFCEVDIDEDEPRYREPLERDARDLAARAPDAEVVLLGSIASGKYVSILTTIFGERLRFPLDFVGRGDMSRGGLMLRRVADGVELAYGPVIGAVLNGKRPPKLTPVRKR